MIKNPSVQQKKSPKGPFNPVYNVEIETCMFLIPCI